MDDLPNNVIDACRTISDFLVETRQESAVITFIGTLRTYGQGERVYTPIAQDMMMLRSNRKEGE